MAPRTQLVRNIFIVISFFNKISLKVAEHVLVLSSTDSSDAKSVTDVILAELFKAELTSSKIIVVARHCVHLVVVHAMLIE